MTSKITFIIPNRGGKHIDFVINQLKKYWPNEEYIVINQEDNEPFKRGQLFNIASNYVNTEYLCFIDNDLFFKQKIDLIGEYNKGCQILMPFNIIEQVEIKGDSYKTTKTGKAITLEGDNRFGPRGGISFISKNMANKLENILGIDIYIETDRTTENELLQKIKELTEENRRLKELLMEKWKH